MAYPFESSIVLTNAACNLIFASETSYITESSAGQIDVYANSVNVMTLTSSGMALTTGSFVDTIETTITDDDTHIPTSGAVVDYVAANSGSVSFGTSGQIPYMNSGGTDFSYTSSVTYLTGIFDVPSLSIASKANDGGILYSTVATGLVTQSTNLKFTGSYLIVGTPTTAYNNAFVAKSMVVASTTATTRSGLELVGNQTTDTSVGTLSWHNTQATQSDKRVSQIDGGRDGDSDAGYLRMYTATTAGTLVQRMNIASDGIITMNLTATALTTGLFNVATSGLNTYVATFFHDGNTTTDKGLKVQCGKDAHTPPSGPPGGSMYLDCYDGNGGQQGYIYGDVGGIYVQSASDKRLKTNIANLSRDAREIVMGVQVREFNWKVDPDGNKVTGYVAQEVMRVFPEMVHYDMTTDLYTVGEAKLIPYMHVVVQTHEERIIELEKELEKLRDKLSKNI